MAACLLSGSGLAVVVTGLAAVVTHQPRLLPSLGPTITAGAVVLVTAVDVIFTRLVGTGMPYWTETRKVADHG